ncbi:MAG TPA: sterol desaturase family protein [Nevskiaceae bacterium]|nr:sterol desaturase family protein [Nevskiaceae bacterium]
MKRSLRVAIRYGAYPVVAGGTLLTLLGLAGAGVGYWPMFPLLSLGGLLAVLALERLQPFEAAWQADHGGDTRVDLLHLLVSQVLIQTAVALAFGARAALPGLPRLWPDQAPMAVQILLAGLVMDAGLYAMHRLSHTQGWLWRLHALHHGPRRLYGLNSGRRHPLSALALALPGLTLLMGLGVTPIALGAWLAFMSVHLAFQHANLDYRLGPMRRWLAVAEMHRWHHRRDHREAQVNYGEVFLFWDALFGTRHLPPAEPARFAVGLDEASPPEAYLAQLRWPFRT